ncbi:MAG: NHLP leader peptide family RiPP precursor [Gemmataceae bacterium]|nr:NHLP leader peptide family RiPP precursor [Gemmataceae bacterium]
MANWQSVIDQAQSDPKFRQRLKTDPVAVLKEAGVPVASGKTVEVVDERPGEMHLFIGAQDASPGVNRILERADKDAAFKQRLLSEPRAVVEEAIGQKLPAVMRVFVHDRTPHHTYLFLGAPKPETEELSDLELETVAGGGLIARVRDFLCRDTPTGGTKTEQIAGTNASITWNEMSGTNRPGAGTYYD